MTFPAKINFRTKVQNLTQ